MKHRIKLFGIEIDALTLEQATRTVLSWAVTDQAECRFVVTPNVDHTVMLRDSQALRDVYEGAHLVLADGWPVVAAARLLGLHLPQRVAGSDLVPHLFSLASDELRVYLLGAMPGVAETAKANIESAWPHVRVVGTYSPRFGFEQNPRECDAILRRIADAKPDVLVVGLGAPKQELWVYQHHDRISAKVALCVGATIDFLAGEKQRAPMWMRRTGLEWLHRAACEPRRLVRRYARDAWIFPQLVWRELRRASKLRHSVPE
jgi:N-acetylglucosaminyldiphosphoundecaprenol N-acetyl-beta-D-mannosaminyltransferase